MKCAARAGNEELIGAARRRGRVAVWSGSSNSQFVASGAKTRRIICNNGAHAAFDGALNPRGIVGCPDHSFKAVQRGFRDGAARSETVMQSNLISFATDCLLDHPARRRSGTRELAVEECSRANASV